MNEIGRFFLCMNVHQSQGANDGNYCRRFFFGREHPPLDRQLLQLVKTFKKCNRKELGDHEEIESLHGAKFITREGSVLCGFYL